MKPANANPGLNVNQIITFSSFQKFYLLCFLYMVIIETENRMPNNIQITKLKSKFYFFLGKLNRALNNQAQELRF